MALFQIINNVSYFPFYKSFDFADNSFNFPFQCVQNNFIFVPVWMKIFSKVQKI